MTSQEEENGAWVELRENASSCQVIQRGYFICLSSCPRLSSTPIHFCMTRDVDKVKALDEEVAKLLEKEAIVKLLKDSGMGLYHIALYSWLKSRMGIGDP